MKNGNHSSGKSPERYSPTLFVTAGVLMAGHAATWGVRSFTDASPPTGVFAASGHLVALVGLIALSGVLPNRTPSLARTAVLTATVPAVGWLAVTVEQLVEVAGVLPPRAVVLPPALYAVVLVSTIVAYVLFTVASHRAGSDSRGIGVLLLAPAALLATVFLARAVLAEPALAGFVTGSGLSLSLLAIGHRLRTVASTDREALVGGLAPG